MDIWQVLDLVTMQQRIGERYLEFFTGSDNLSMGIYVLPADDTDPQSPHTEDEAYYVLSGHASITVDGETQPVQPGSLIYVGTGVEHKFHDITENLMLLVIFAPPRRSRAR
jgi:mannose-6-phosphate isomerase-like protein (cupin superfamily)